MRNHTLLYCMVGLLLGAILVCASTIVAAGNIHTSHAWILAQEKTPLLWMVDGSALIILVGSCWMGAAISELQGESASQTDENRRHIAVLTETVQDLFRQNNDYASRLEALEETGEAWHEGFEEEARRLTEQAFLAISDNIESNAMQLEAVTLALRYQRAEMQALRTAFKTGEIAQPSGPPPSLDTVDRPIKRILPEWRKPQSEPETAPDKEAVEENEVAEAEAHTDKVDVDAAADTHNDAEIVSNSSDHEEDAELDRVVLSQGKTEPEDVDGANQSDTEEVSEPAATEPDEEKETINTISASEQTVNARTTVVEMLEFDIESDTAVVGERDTMDAQPNVVTPADEFRRSRQEAKSIFRKKWR